MQLHAANYTHRLRSAPAAGDYGAHVVSYLKHQRYSNIDIARLLTGKGPRMKRTPGLDLQAAASAIGFKGGRRALKAFLTEQGCIYGTGIPHSTLAKQGLLIADTRQYTVANYVRKQYSVLLVTPKGLSWLQELADKHGKTTQTVRSRNHRDAQQGRPPRSTSEGACTPA